MYTQLFLVWDLKIIICLLACFPTMNCEDSYPCGGVYMYKSFSKISRVTFGEYAQSSYKDHRK